MEHESFEDTAVARIMNEHFVNIKVDREERPDVDDVYMTACHLATGRNCGWPLNAFALPDGNIVVFTGIIDAVENANELSGLIGHEAAHVNKRHSMKMLCRNLSGYLFISAVFNDVNGITAIIGDNIHSLQSMSYSRTFEKEADIEALEILQQNNIDPKGMLLLFDRLESHSVIEIPEFLSSHPITKERSNYIKELITKKKIKIVSNKKTEDLFKKLKKAL